MEVHPKDFRKRTIGNFSRSLGENRGMALSLLLLASASALLRPLPTTSAPLLLTSALRPLSRAILMPCMMADGQSADGSVPSSASKALEDKMKGWEASEEEQRAKTLGGKIPLVGMPGRTGRMTRKDQPTRADGFDITMGISAVILFPLAVILFTFPFWIGSVDISSVGPPPTS
jgi:hypothetical protein